MQLHPRDLQQWKQENFVLSYKEKQREKHKYIKKNRKRKRERKERKNNGSWVTEKRQKETKK